MNPLVITTDKIATAAQMLKETRQLSPPLGGGSSVYSNGGEETEESPFAGRYNAVPAGLTLESCYIFFFDYKLLLSEIHVVFPLQMHKFHKFDVPLSMALKRK